MIAIRKVLFKDFINFQLQHLNYVGKDRKFYRITNLNIIYEFENNGEELIVREFFNNTTEKVEEDEFYEYYEYINGLFDTSRYHNGVLHKTDGPAITYSDKYDPLYYINGILVTEHFFNKIMKNLKKGRIGNILNKYSSSELELIRSIVEEQGKTKDLDKVDKWILIKKLEE